MNALEAARHAVATLEKADTSDPAVRDRAVNWLILATLLAQDPTRAEERGLQEFALYLQIQECALPTMEELGDAVRDYFARQEQGDERSDA